MYLWAFKFKRSTFCNFTFKIRSFIESRNLLHSPQDLNAFNQLSRIRNNSCWFVWFFLNKQKHYKAGNTETWSFKKLHLGKQTQRRRKSCPSRVLVEGWYRTEIRCCEDPCWPSQESPFCCGARRSSHLAQENINAHKTYYVACSLFSADSFRGFKFGFTFKGFPIDRLPCIAFSLRINV